VCGARVEQTVTDWSDEDGRRLVVDETPLWCAECSASNAGRRVGYPGTDGLTEISVEGVVGVRRVSGRIVR